MDTNGVHRTIYKVVLTGGPCGGKTTGQDRLSTFFENLGWKVFRVPETATVILKGGVRFSELSATQMRDFQEDLLLAMMNIENLFFRLADSDQRDCLVICDRGTMDASAYIDPEGWQTILMKNGLNPVDLRDNRYNQVVHMVTAAMGAERFYTTANNIARSETPREAADKDMRTREVWIGHPYVDIVDNQDCRNFEDKILKLIQVVCDRVGIEYGDRLALNSRKRKFLISAVAEPWSISYEQFDVLHDYLFTDAPDTQSRIRKRGQNGRFSYTHTIRRIVKGEPIETRRHISQREYGMLKAHKDSRRISTFKKRRCFVFGERYFQLDTYQKPLPPKCPEEEQLQILETFTTWTDPILSTDLPSFLTVEKEVTGDPAYSMYVMSLRDDATPGAIDPKPPAEGASKFSFDTDSVLAGAVAENGKV